MTTDAQIDAALRDFRRQQRVRRYRARKALEDAGLPVPPELWRIPPEQRRSAPIIRARLAEAEAQKTDD